MIFYSIPKLPVNLAASELTRKGFYHPYDQTEHSSSFFFSPETTLLSCLSVSFRSLVDFVLLLPVCTCFRSFFFSCFLNFALSSGGC